MVNGLEESNDENTKVLLEMRKELLAPGALDGRDQSEARYADEEPQSGW